MQKLLIALCLAVTFSFLVGAQNCGLAECGSCLNTTGCTWCNQSGTVRCRTFAQCSAPSTNITDCPVTPSPIPTPVPVNCGNFANCDSCLNVSNSGQCSWCNSTTGFLRCRLASACVAPSVNVTACPLPPTPTPVPPPCTNFTTCDTCASPTCDWCVSGTTGATRCATRNTCGGSAPYRNASQCSSIPVNDCGLQTSCDTCTASKINSTSNTSCTWCDRATGAACISGNLCGLGTPLNNCSLANPCFAKTNCGDCNSAIEGCRWCESGTIRQCVRNNTGCGGGGQQPITNCSAASTCYQNSDCTSCNANSCSWCPGVLGGNPTCSQACNGAPLTCPVAPSPVVATSVVANPPPASNPSGVNPPSNVVAPTDAAPSNAPADAPANSPNVNPPPGVNPPSPTTTNSISPTKTPSVVSTPSQGSSASTVILSAAFVTVAAFLAL